MVTTLGAAQNKINGHENRRGRWKKIGELTILPGAGLLGKADSNGHQTWWPTKSFDVMENCKAL